MAYKLTRSSWLEKSTKFNLLFSLQLEYANINSKINVLQYIFISKYYIFLSLSTNFNFNFLFYFKI